MNKKEEIQENLLIITRTYDAPVEKVFAAWTEPTQLKQWFCPESMTVPIAEATPAVGQHYRIEMKNSNDESFIVAGTYKEIVPNQKLVFSWGWENSDFKDGMVTVKFVKQGQQTELTLQHEKFVDQDSCKKHHEGWVSCLAHLGNFLK